MILAGPVLYAMYRTGGTGMAMWLSLCSLAGITISVVAPLLAARNLKLVIFELDRMLPLGGMLQTDGELL